MRKGPGLRKLAHVHLNITLPAPTVLPFVPLPLVIEFDPAPRSTTMTHMITVLVHPDRYLSSPVDHANTLFPPANTDAKGKGKPTNPESEEGV